MTPKVFKPEPTPEQAKSSKLTPSIKSLSINSRKRKVHIEDSSDEECTSQMPVIESVVNEDPSKPHKSPETPEVPDVQLSKSQELSKELYASLKTEKPVRKSLRRRLSFKVTMPSGRAVDGKDIKRIALDNLEITKFGAFLPEGKKAKYKRFGFVIAYKDKRNGDLFLPIQPLRTKNMTDDEFNKEQANLQMVQYFLKEKIKEFLNELPKNI